jgi:hypothetical protein
MLKTCSHCHTTKPLDAFNKHPHARFGVGNKCRECAKAYNRAHYQANADVYIANATEWRKSRPDEYSKHASKSKKVGRVKHASRVNADNAMRRAEVKRATPSWANLFFIAEAYHIAKVREQVLGGKWHVDHVIPLRGKTVCGLHVENNLQVIPAKVNLKKHATFET